jgi:hypothetical protein
MKFYGDQSLAMLRTAIAKGYKDAARIRRDKGLNALRQCEDFKKLLAELEAKQKPAGK